MDTEKIITFITFWGLKVTGAILLTIAGYIGAKVAAHITNKAMNKANVDKTIGIFVSKVVYYTVLTLVAIAVLGVFGIETTSFVAVLGTIGLAIGLAMQGTLSNIASGVMLMLFRPFKVGDLIEAGGIVGTVEEIELFTTRVHTPDNVKVVIPNASIYGQIIKVYTANPHRRVDLTVGISYDDDIGRAVEIINRVLAENELVLDDPAPTVAVSELADSSVNLAVRPWCKPEHYWDVYFGVLRSVKEALDSEGISIPYPQHDIHIVDQASTAQ